MQLLGRASALRLWSAWQEAAIAKHTTGSSQLVGDFTDFPLRQAHRMRPTYTVSINLAPPDHSAPLGNEFSPYQYVIFWVHVIPHSTVFWLSSNLVNTFRSLLQAYICPTYQSYAATPRQIPRAPAQFNTRHTTPKTPWATKCTIATPTLITSTRGYIQT